MSANDTAPDTSSTTTTTKLPAGPIIFVIGPPGAGKSNLCAEICEWFPGGFRHLSVGRYLRELFSNDGEEASTAKPCSGDSETGCLPPDEIENYLRENRTLPAETIVPLIKAKLLGSDPSSSACWLIEGFPRDVKTALAFEREIKVPAGVIKVVCDPETSRERFLNRQLVTPHIEERFQRRMDEHEDNWRDLTIHYGTLEILKVNSNGAGWVTGIPELLNANFKDLVALTGSREGQ